MMRVIRKFISSASQHVAYGTLFVSIMPRLLAQDYHWPTDAGQVITSSFGEYRSGHFHAGVDFKTWGRIGYKIFAIEDGSIVRVRISPYGYGRAVYIRLEGGITVVYAHLSRFSDPVETLMKAEQKRRGRFAVEKYFTPGFLPVKKGDVLGYTGRSGTRDPHLHFEVRDRESRPFNPLSLPITIKDTIPPVVRAIAVSPLTHASHVEGDFLPKTFSLRRQKRGLYVLDDVIRAWGELGFSISGFDQANGASNRFALYRIRFFVDGYSIFSARYDRFSYDQTQQIELDRDYRMKNWGWGLFQKLYVDVGNNLPFYEPSAEGAGVLTCRDHEESGLDPDDYLTQESDNGEGPIHLSEGDHTFRIEVADFYGNLSEVNGVIRMMPLTELAPEPFLEENPWGANISRPVTDPDVDVDIQVFEKYIRFGLEFSEPLSAIPSLFTGLHTWDKRYVALMHNGSQSFMGTIPWEDGSEGVLTTEVRFSDPYGQEKTVQESMQVFAIKPETGGTILSSDGHCAMMFPGDAVYQAILTYCVENPAVNLEDMESVGKLYGIFPQDVLLKRSAKVMIDVRDYTGDREKLGIYAVRNDGGASFMGNNWENGMVSAWTGNLRTFTVLKDTVAPEIVFVYPGPDIHIRNKTPRIVVGFKDRLSGISGEDDYTVYLDNTRLIIEYDPIHDLGFHRIETPLEVGKHFIDVIIHDRAGNTIMRRSAFIIDP